MGLFSSSLSKQNKILTYCPEAVLIVSSNEEIIFSNKAAEEIFDSSNINSKGFTELIGTSLETLNSSEDQKHILQIKTETEEDKIIDIKLTKLPSEDNYIVTVIDVTKAHKLIQMLVDEESSQDRVNHLKNTLISKLANNLTAPLQSSIGFSQAILEGLGGEINEKQSKYINIIHKNSSELLFLLEQLIDLSELEAGLYELEYKNFDVTTLLSTIIKENNYLAEEKSLKIITNTEQLERKNCSIDEKALKAIITNFLKSAVMSCDSGNITINLATPELEFLEEKNIHLPKSVSEKSFIKIEIMDEGVGIPSNELDNLFDPYVQADKTVKKNLLRGLILAISKKLIESLKGIIWVESEIMKGSKFTFLIPIERLAETQVIEISPENLVEETEEITEIEANENDAEQLEE